MLSALVDYLALSEKQCFSDEPGNFAGGWGGKVDPKPQGRAVREKWEVMGECSGRGHLFQDPPWTPKSVDAQVPNIKWHSTVGPVYLLMRNLRIRSPRTWMDGRLPLGYKSGCPWPIEATE